MTKAALRLAVHFLISSSIVILMVSFANGMTCAGLLWEITHVYEDKAQGGALWKNFRCQKQKRKRYAGGRDRRGQIHYSRP
jgi:hypothetical protein